MQIFLRPQLIFVINSLPLLILISIAYGDFQIIESQLSEEGIHLWKSFGLALISLFATSLIYALVATRMKANIHASYAIISLITHITFLYLFNEYSRVIQPFSIPFWMVPHSLFLYAGSFIMPTLAHNMFILVQTLFNSNGIKKPWLNFLSAIMIPLVWYLFFQVIFPLWQPLDNKYQSHVFGIVFIVSTVLFIFFLLRFVYAQFVKKEWQFSNTHVLIRLLVGGILPVTGLIVNNESFGGLFGDFTNPLFYIIAVTNAVFLCAEPTDNTSRFYVYLGRCFCFSYSLYFFFVFLPFLPFSIIAIIAVGMGFLMLTPLALLPIHILAIHHDFQNLLGIYKVRTLLFSGAFMFMLIPLILFATFSNDKRVIKQALDYTYSPEYGSEVKINKRSLRRTLDLIDYNKAGRFDMIFFRGLPFITSFFNWHVLDNLTLSDKKIDKLERIFFGKELLKEGSRARSQRQALPSMVDLSDLNVRSEYVVNEGLWYSWIDLELTNNATGSWLEEYSTQFELPEGAWIKDYYLYVGDRKEMGLLTEKKSAMWVYASIRNRRRDPGILYYKTGNKINFRVFPFNKDEVRRTGIQIIHRDPVSFKIDDQEIALGNIDNSLDFETNFKIKNLIYVSEHEKSQLSPIKRKPYFHFIVDASRNTLNHKEEIQKRFESFIEQNDHGLDGAKISFLNSYDRQFNLDENWQNHYQSFKSEGGFFLERGVKNILQNACGNTSDQFPIIIVLTKDLNNSIIEKDFNDFMICYPDSDYFYHLRADGNLYPHSLWNAPKEEILVTSIDPIEINEVLAWPNASKVQGFLRNDKGNGMLWSNEKMLDHSSSINNTWEAGLGIQSDWINQILYPSKNKDEWLTIIECSFNNKIMSPLTSYIVVETEAQKQALLRKQQEVLKADKNYDLGDEVQEMSEPSLLMLIAVIVLMLLISRILQMHNLHQQYPSLFNFLKHLKLNSNA